MNSDGMQDVIKKIFLSEKALDFGSKIVSILLIVIIGIIITKITTKVVNSALKRTKVDPILYNFIRNVINVIAGVIIITMVLGALGVQMHTIIAVVGAAGAAIALALRDSLANVAGGVMIIITKPFCQGDFIDIGEVSGKVQHIDLFLTTLKTYDNRTITIPNGVVNTSTLINHSSEKTRRVDCTFGIGYDDDIEKVKEVMNDVCQKNPDILKDEEIVMGVINQGESAVIMDLKVWCETSKYWDVKYYLEENIKIAFDANGIRIPYPQMDINIKK